jgi:hypothetical protein
MKREREERDKMKRRRVSMKGQEEVENEETLLLVCKK